MKHPHTHVPLLIFAVSVALFVFALYGYMHRTVGISLEHALTARDAVAKEQSLKVQKKNLTDIYERTAADRQRLVSLFVSDAETIAFIETIESFAEKAGSEVVISSLQSDNLEAQPEGTLGKISVHADVKGSWSAVMRTLQLAEVLPYKVSISNVSVDTSGFSEISSAGTTGSGAKAAQLWNGRFTIEATLIHVPSTQ